MSVEYDKAGDSISCYFVQLIKTDCCDMCWTLGNKQIHEKNNYYVLFSLI